MGSSNQSYKQRLKIKALDFAQLILEELLEYIGCSLPPSAPFYMLVQFVKGLHITGIKGEWVHVEIANDPSLIHAFGQGNKSLLSEKSEQNLGWRFTMFLCNSGNSWIFQ